ncbi:MAG: nicotinate phosphoribosyltransferase [Candidatus Parvarchaeum sp.]
MEKLNSLLMNDSEMPLFLDYYELTSGQANFDHGRNNKITEVYYFRNIPENLGGYMVATGLEQVISFIKNFKLSKEEAEWLKESSNGALTDDFLDYLQNFKFKGNVNAVPEGTVVFPNEPIITVTGNSIEVQLFETYILSVMNFQTMVATKAARIAYASNGKAFLDFGARRAHGRDAAILSSRASYIGGAAGTALVSAAMKLGIPYSGTMPHKFVQERESELEAFREYAESFPNDAVFLIDTYDTLKGAQNACIVGNELRRRGYDLKGVRIDGGDLLQLSRQVRRILDDNGFSNTKIIASSDLDEYQIDYFVKNNAPIDIYGVGTRLDTAANYNSISKKGGVSALGGVYKLVEEEENGTFIPKIKISSSDKTTLPFNKQIYRRFEDGFMLDDIIDRPSSNKYKGYQQLLVPAIEGGKLVYDFPSLKEIKEYTKRQLSSLQERYRRLEDFEPFPVRIGKDILDARNRIMEEKLNS